MLISITKLIDMVTLIWPFPLWCWIFTCKDEIIWNTWVWLGFSFFWSVTVGHYLPDFISLGCVRVCACTYACVCVRACDCWSSSLVLSCAHAPLSIAVGLFICIKCSCLNKALFVWIPTHMLMESARSHSWFTSIVLKLLSPDYGYWSPLSWLDGWSSLI